MKFDNTKVMNFEGAFRGMRAPLESWAKSDSVFDIDCQHEDSGYEIVLQIADAWTNYELKDTVFESEDEYNKEFDRIMEKRSEWLWEQGAALIGTDHHCTLDLIGPNDMGLAQRLIAGGSEHRKFLRQIFVSVDITAPLYWQASFCQ